MTLRRGDVVVVADGSGQFTGKPRPAVVVQSDAFGERATVTLCPLTSRETDAPLFRVPIAPSAQLKLTCLSWAEVDLITTVRRSRVSTELIGHLSPAELVRLSASMAVYLGIG